MKPTQKQSPMPQQAQPNLPGYSPAFNAWIGTKATDAKDERMEDGGNAQGTGDTDSGGFAAGVPEAEAAAMKLEGLRTGRRGMLQSTDSSGQASERSSGRRPF